MKLSEKNILFTVLFFFPFAPCFLPCEDYNNSHFFYIKNKMSARDITVRALYNTAAGD